MLPTVSPFDGEKNKKHYTDEQKQMALSLYYTLGKDASKTSRYIKEHFDFAPSHNSILDWVSGKYINEDVRAGVSGLNKTLAEKFEDTCHKLVDAVVGKIDEATFRELIQAIGVIAPQMHLLKGDPTAITQTTMTDEEKQMRLLEIFTAAKERQARLTATPAIDIQSEVVYHDEEEYSWSDEEEKDA